jgi:cytochrome c oxidase subunit II
MTRQFQRLVSLGRVSIPFVGVIVFIRIPQSEKDAGHAPSVSKCATGWVLFASRAVSAALLSLFLMSPVAKPESARRVQVMAKRYAFEPAVITVKKGEAVDLVLTSADVPHGLRFRELKIELHANKGKTVETIFTPQTTGTFVGHCSVFCGSGHGVMTLTIHVVS